jgi:membrane protein implicated in regulation of membrane protease activity
MDYLPRRKHWIKASCLYVAMMPLIYLFTYIDNYLELVTGNLWVDWGFFACQTVVMILYIACYLTKSLTPRKVHIQQAIPVVATITILSATVPSDSAYALLIFCFYGFFYRVLDKKKKT